MADYLTGRKNSAKQARGEKHNQGCQRERKHDDTTSRELNPKFPSLHQKGIVLYMLCSAIKAAAVERKHDFAHIGSRLRLRA